MLLVDEKPLDALRNLARPDNVQIHRGLVRAQSEMQSQIVLISFAGTRFNMTCDDSVTESYSRHGADSRTIDLLAVAFECYFDPIVRAGAVDEQLAG